MENIKFGTVTPIKYLDTEVNIPVDIVAHGVISIAQEIPEDEIRQIQMTVIMELQKQIGSLSGSVKASQLPAHSAEFNKQLSALISEKFNILARVSILNLTMTEQSKQEYAQKVEEKLKASFTPASSNPTIQIAQVSAKYCPNCGTPSTGKFCSNCGTKLS